MKVLFISGFGRSGSTLIEGIISSAVENSIALGELCFLVDRGYLNNGLCSCGSKICDCDLWREIYEKTKLNSEKLKQLQSEKNRIYRLRNINKAFHDDNFFNNGNIYTNFLQEIFQILEEKRYELIIDSSKFPAHGKILKTMNGIDLHVLHLVRDPRGVCYSWQKKMKYEPTQPDSVLMDRFGVLKSTLLWNVFNDYSDKFQDEENVKYTLCRYEDFVAHPHEVLNRLLASMSLERSGVADIGTIEPKKGHSVSGNPARFSRNRFILKNDDEWRKDLGIWQRTVATVFGLKKILKYKYPVIP